MFSITILETVSGCLELNFPNFLGLLCIFSVSSTKQMQVNIENWCSTQFNTKHIARVKVKFCEGYLKELNLLKLKSNPVKVS